MSGRGDLKREGSSVGTQLRPITSAKACILLPWELLSHGADIRNPGTQVEHAHLAPHCGYEKQRERVGAG